MRFRIMVRNLQRTVRERIFDSCAVLCTRRLFLRQLRLENLAQNVSGKDMRLLNARQIARGNFKQEVSRLGDQSSPLSRKRNRDGTNLARRLESEEDVSAVAGGGDGHDNIPLSREGLHLALKDVLVAVIVAGGGEDRRIGGERDGGDAGPVVAKTHDKLSIQVLRVRRAAAVAAPEDLAAHPNGENHFGRDLIENVLLVVKRFDDLEVFGESGLEDAGAVGSGFGHVVVS